jgi:5,10-methylenetetrahydrofolate reductase
MLRQHAGCGVRRGLCDVPGTAYGVRLGVGPDRYTSSVPSNVLLDSLRSSSPLVSVELRPPRAELDAAAGRDAWIDTYHAVRGLVRGGTFVFLTDSAVGAREEHNLRHLVINLGTDVPRNRVVPFLTSKHSLAFCLSYAERAWQEGFSSLVVLGGDRSIGAPRCVEHAWQLRAAIRRHVPELALGGWANPHADAVKQTDYLVDGNFAGEFFLTQVVSHHDAARVDAFMCETTRRGISLPGVFGVFYYRSANPKTLASLRHFLPVPVEGLSAEFAAGATPELVCARTIRSLRASGITHFYVSNLPVGRARATLEKILSLADE